MLTREFLKGYLNVKVGDFTYGEPLVVPQEADITIGAYTSIAEQVELICKGDHTFRCFAQYPFTSIVGLGTLEPHRTPNRPKRISIGSDVWIGWGALILHGSLIGDGAVVGAGSVIAGEVRPYAIVSGNPARETGRRFSDETVDKLLRIKWWEWPREKIERYAHLFYSDDIEALCSI